MLKSLTDEFEFESMRNEVVEEEFVVAHVLEVGTATNNTDCFTDDKAFVDRCKNVGGWLYVLVKI